MFSTRKPLIFNWYVNENRIKEYFARSSYYPKEDEYEICDYIFQRHIVLCTYRYENLESNLENPDLALKEFYLKNIELDELFLKAVSALKYFYALILRFGKKWNSYGDQERLKKINSLKGDILDLPRNTFFDQTKNAFTDALNFYEREKDSSRLEEWFENIREKIQEKADEIVDNMEKLHKNNLWNDFEDNIKKKPEAKSLLNLDSKIKKFAQQGDEIFKTIDVLANCYKHYIKKNQSQHGGCYVLCIIDKKKYYSLSGIDDYTGNDSRIRGLFNGVNINALVNKLSPGSTFTYAPLTDDVNCYGFMANKAYLRKHLKLIPFVDMCMKLTPPKCNKRDFSCCERKIMALQRNGKDYKFYIRFEPCFLCLPDLLPEDNKKIVSFIPSNSGCKMLTVRAVLKAPFYELF